MLKVIGKTKKINELQQKFVEVITDSFDSTVTSYLGYQGGSSELELHYSKKHNFWLSPGQGDNRFWNAFGVGKPMAYKNTSILCEINFPFRGIDRRIAGVFAKDSNGSIIVLHRGKIGGGRKGVGKKLFSDNFRGKFIDAIDGEQITTFAFVGHLFDDNFIEQLKDFVFEIDRIKNQLFVINEEYPETPNEDFSEEFEGIKTYSQEEMVIADCSHGMIVNSLARILEEDSYTVFNDRFRDLFIKKGTLITHLFEIKSNLSTSSVYSGIGQLYFHCNNSKTKKIIVLPDSVSESMISKLNNLEIGVITFNINDGSVNFSNFSSIL